MTRFKYGTQSDGEARRVKQALYAPKLLYAIGSAGQSALSTYIGIYYQHSAEFTEWEIGILQTLPCICAILSPPIWGMIADYCGDQRAIHNFCLISSTLTLFSISYVKTFGWNVLAIVFVGNFLAAPCGSLQDHAILHMLKETGGEYGKQRLFGAIGWGAGAYVVSILVHICGLNAAFYFFLAFLLLSVLVLQYIPSVNMREEKAAHDILLDKKQSFSSNTFYDRICHLFQYQRNVIALLSVIFLMALMFGVLSSYLTMYLYNMSGGNAQIVGVAIVCETLSEIPAFFYSQRLIDSLGVAKVLLISALGYGIRITYYYVMENPWTVIPVELLHGLTFGLAWAACTHYVFMTAQKGFEGSMMGILNAVQNGLGRGAGTLIGGYLYQTYSPKIMWLITDLGVPITLIGIASFSILQRMERQKSNLQAFTAQEQVIAEAETAQLLTPHTGHTQSIFKDLQ